MSTIYFFAEEITFQLPYDSLMITWIENCIQCSDKKLIQLNYIFCSDTYLHKLNKTYLNHDYFTDVITFSHADKSDELEGDAYVSIERVREHSDTLGTTFYQELCRVLIHAVLHLIGYDDKTAEEKHQMRALEDFWLAKPVLKVYLNKVYSEV